MNNFTKNVAPGTDKAFIPSGLEIKKLQLINHRDEVVDLKFILHNFSITESLYSPTIIAKFEFIEAANSIEELKLIGEERIKLLFGRRNHDISRDDDEEIEFELFVTEFPKFDRRGNENVQNFAISAVSRHAFINKTKKISRAFNDNTLLEIRKILETDLGVTNIVELGSAISRSRGVLPFQRPLTAVEYLRKNSFNDLGAPFYVFQTLGGEVILGSHSDLIESPTYETYFDYKVYNKQVLSKQDYIQRKIRMLEVSSKLGFGKIFNAQKGAYASENNYLDLGNKTYTKTDYTFGLSSTLNPKSTVSDTFEVDYKNEFKSHCEYISTNEFAFNGETKNHNNLRKLDGHRVTSYLENFEFTQHDIKFFGDANLNAGKIIELRFPKAMEVNERRRFLTESDPSDMFDQNLSGKYLVVSAIHKFQDGEYFTNVRVKKDSMSGTFNI